MNRLLRLKYPLLILIIVSLSLSCFFIGSKYTLDHLVIRQVTPTQIANAMKDDHFWVSYREDILLISGKVISIAHIGSETIVGLKTDSTFNAQCSFSKLNKAPSTGQIIKVLSIANSAERLKSGVKLNNCTTP